MREEVCAQTRGSGSLLERTSEKWGCKLSTRHRESRFSEETEKNSLSPEGEEAHNCRLSGQNGNPK